MSHKVVAHKVIIRQVIILVIHRLFKLNCNYLDRKTTVKSQQLQLLKIK